MITRKLFFLTTILCFACLQMHAQEIVYQKEDSIFIENVLQKHIHEPNDRIVISIAKDFAEANTEYEGGTLDAYNEEPLFVNCTKLDCTTFAELVLAMAFTKKENRNGFEAVCNNLEKIRYRNGVRNGYESRLHYISWWIADSAKKDIIEEITTPQHTAVQKLHLNFMSANSDKYPLLANDITMQQKIAVHERPFQEIDIAYIPKELLNTSPEQLNIKDGDIIAIVTGIKGLDVTHLGFALWKEKKLHMLHASSAKGKVVDDSTTLYDYMKNKKMHLGVRVFRMKEDATNHN